MDTDGGWGGAQLITDRRTGVIIAAFRDGQELWRVIPGYRDGLSEGMGGGDTKTSRGSDDEMSEDGIKTSERARSAGGKTEKV